MKNIFEVVDDDERKEEVAPGVTITRRRMLLLPAATAAALVFGRDSFGQSAAPLPAWDDFLKECLPKAKELHRDSTRNGQEAYLRWLGLMATKIKATELPPAKLGKYKGLEPASSFGVGYRGEPFFVVEWRMEPRAFLPPHNHPNVSVCAVGLEGEAHLRNYEIVGEAPEFASAKSFRVRETHNETFGPGRINTLSTLRDNIHSYRAGKEGARGVDITTYHGPNVGFSHLEIAGKSMDEQQRVYEAVWKKL